MKINLNYAQIIITAILTSAAFLIYINYFQKERHDLHTPTMEGVSTSASDSTTNAALDSIEALSERIRWDSANTLASEYQERMPRIMMTTYMEGANPRVAVLKGFTFKSSHLKELLLKNNSGTNPDSVYFMFGTAGIFDDNEAGVERPNMRIVAVGLKNNIILNTPLPGRIESVFDKADPCPPHCPVVQ